MHKFLSFLFVISFNSFSQIVKVSDVYTQEILEEIDVENTTTKKRYVTNKEGWFKVEEKDKKGFFVFKNKNYQTKKVPYQGLKKGVSLKPYYQDLKSIVLSVSRAAEKKQKIPEQIEIITKKKIGYISPQTSADLLANVPGVRVQKSQLGGGSPVIRGMESNRVLLVVDGVRLNNAIYRSGHLQNSITISPLALQRTEVVFGPASVTYGSDALGGVIHYYTKNLGYSKKQKIKNNVFYRHSTVNNEHSANFSSYISKKKWVSFSNISYSSFDDLKMGKNRTHGYKNWGKVFQYSKNTKTDFYENSSVNSDATIQRNTGYHQLDVLQKFMFPVHKNIDFVLNGQFSKSSDIPNFGKLNDTRGDGLKFAEWRYGPQQRLLVSGQLKFKDHNFSLLENGTITLAYQNILESRINRKFESLDRVTRKENVNVFSLNSDFYKSLTKRGDRKLYYGLELVHNDVASKAKGETLLTQGHKIKGVSSFFNADTRYPNNGSTYSNAAVYSSYRQQLNSKNTLNIGLRYTNTLLKAKWNQNVSVPIPDNSITLHNNAITGSVGYIYRPKENHKISVVLSKGFRSPNVDDIGKIRSKSGKITVPNTNLKPEELYSAELGYSKTLKNRRAYFNTNMYYTLLDNYISRSPSVEFGNTIQYDGEVFENENIIANNNQGQAYIYGATVSGFWKILKNLKTNMSVSYTKGVSYDRKEPLSSIPPLFGNISVGFYKEKYNVALEYRFSSAKKLEDYNVVEGIDNLDETPNGLGTPSWSVFNLNSNYYVNNDLKLQFQFQNILDVHYKEFGSSLSAPGRNIVASVAYSF